MKDGHSGWCKSCELAKRDQYYKADPSKGRAASSRFRKNHLAKVVAANKQYRAENRDKVSQWNQNRPLAKKLLNAAKRRAIKRGLPCTITVGDISIPEICPVLGVEIKVSKGMCGPNSPSLDCIIPSLGYVPGNIAVISFRANTIKSDATVDEVKKVAAWMEQESSRLPEASDS